MRGYFIRDFYDTIGIKPSYSRPRIKNDNPFIESNFRFLKNNPQFPDRPFQSLEECRSWLSNFVKWYNEKHLHKSLRYITPNQKHSNEDAEILKKRIRVFEDAKKSNPVRWSGVSRNWNRVESTELLPYGVRSLNEIRHLY